MVRLAAQKLSASALACVHWRDRIAHGAHTLRAVNPLSATGGFAYPLERGCFFVSESPGIEKMSYQVVIGGIPNVAPGGYRIFKHPLKNSRIERSAKILPREVLSGPRTTTAIFGRPHGSDLVLDTSRRVRIQEDPSKAQEHVRVAKSGSEGSDRLRGAGA
ncbi:hypothetical protein BCR34DRAFT_185604 [Clohesyomyces aquaticus]|uniref:Uncharacterized protein n=1 Tax=Clohesyomyces aquaticus TaxID=1231657 RepID=A0A1Y1YDS3_9PLEO|nr:hypothetical protein BCR34DRAFT_185604 [Clohesyomyces aquaticus]